jgi:hypothetical protein
MFYTSGYTHLRDSENRLSKAKHAPRAAIIVNSVVKVPKGTTGTGSTSMKVAVTVLPDPTSMT